MYLLTFFFSHEAKGLIREFGLKSLVTEWFFYWHDDNFGNSIITITFQARLVVTDLSSLGRAKISGSLIEMALN